MQSLERLFGRQITNVNQQDQLFKNNLRKNKPALRSQSFCGEEAKNQCRGRQAINPNVSQRIQKPKFSKQSEEVNDLKESLTDYFDQSISFMLAQQANSPLNNNSLTRQSDITQGMRTILLDWIVDIHLKYKMFPQTLFIITAIIDKYFSIRNVKKEELQLVGAASILIAAKYQETYQVPLSNELVSLSAKAFTKNDLLKMEADIVKALEFNLIFNTPYHFFDPFCKISDYDQKRFYLAQYTLELALMDPKFLKFKPSLLAASAIFLINKIKRAQVVWPDVLMAASGYQEKELRSCARQLCQLLQQSDSMNNIKCLKRKFSLPKYYEVSKIRLQKKDKLKN